MDLYGFVWICMNLNEFELYEFEFYCLRIMCVRARPRQWELSVILSLATESLGNARPSNRFPTNKPPAAQCPVIFIC